MPACLTLRGTLQFAFVALAVDSSLLSYLIFLFRLQPFQLQFPFYSLRQAAFGFPVDISFNTLYLSSLSPSSFLSLVFPIQDFRFLCSSYRCFSCIVCLSDQLLSVRTQNNHLFQSNLPKVSLSLSSPRLCHYLLFILFFSQIPWEIVKAVTHMALLSTP